MNKWISHLAVWLSIFLVIVLAWCDVFRGWGMSASEQSAFVILLVAALLWISEAIPLFVTSFVILAYSSTWLLHILVEDGKVATRAIFLAPFSSDIILLFLGGFVLSAGLSKYHVDEQAARWVMRKTGSSGPRLLAGIMLITTINSMLLSNTATAAMMMTLALPILYSLPPGHQFRRAIILAIPFAANIGGMATPIGSPPNAIAIQYLISASDGNAVGFITWMVAAIPLVVILLVFAWYLLVKLYDGKNVIVEQESKALSIKRSWRRSMVLGISAITIIGWLTSSLHPFSSGTVALIPVIVFFGTRTLDIRDLRNLSWDVLIVMGGGLCLGVVISVSGLSGWIVQGLTGGAVPETAFFVGFTLIACLLSNLMSNTATANLLMPIVLGLGLTNPSPLFVAVAFACSSAMALPISTPPNAIAFSSGEIKVKDIFIPGLAISVFAIFLVNTVGRYWWDLIGAFQ